MPFCLISEIIYNFDIKQKKAWNICFIICHQLETVSGKIKTNKNTGNLGQNTSLFCKK